MSLGVSDRYRLDELTHRIIGARGIIRNFFPARNVGLSILPRESVRATVREQLALSRGWQRRAALLRLRCGA